MSIDQNTAVEIQNNYGHEILDDWPMRQSNFSDNMIIDIGNMTDDQMKKYYECRNKCGKCGGKGVRVNYDMMWGEADLYCNKCKSRIRGMDFG